jgi:hypothetical protein
MKRLSNITISCYILSVLTFATVHHDVFSQESEGFLFIGDSFFKNHQLVKKFQDTHFKMLGLEISVDSSLLEGMSFIQQVENNEALVGFLKRNSYRYIILQSPSLLSPGITNEIIGSIKHLTELAPKTEKILLVTMDECGFFPKYKCKNQGGDTSCNIYKTCEETEDTIRSVSRNLVQQIDNLTIVPFHSLKNRIRTLPFYQKEDIYGHPSDEMQELLARFLLYWFASDEDVVSRHDMSTWFYEDYKSLKENHLIQIQGAFLQLLKNKHDYE